MLRNCLLGALVALALPASAAPKPLPQLETGAPALAQQRYLIGREHYRKGEFKRAAAEFASAFDVFPKSAKLAFNLARCLERLNQIEEAITAYETYMRLDPTGDNVRSLISGLKRRAAKSRPTLVLSTVPSGASVLIDNLGARGITPARLRVSPGAHVLRFRKAGFAEAVETIRLVRGEERTLTVQLKSTTAPAAVSPPTATQSSTAPSLRPTIGWSLVGVGALVALSGGVFHLQANGTRDDAAKLGPSRAEDAERQSLNDDFDQQRLFGWIGVGVGGAVMAAGLLALIPEDELGTTAYITPSGLALGGRF